MGFSYCREVLALLRCLELLIVVALNPMIEFHHCQCNQRATLRGNHIICVGIAKNFQPFQVLFLIHAYSLCI